MSKIDLKIKLNSSESNIDLIARGIKSKSKIKYKEGNVLVLLDLFDNIVKMNRSCLEYEINLLFEKGKKTISNYKVFGSNKTFSLETITNELIITDKKVIIDYNLEGNDFKFSLEVI